MLSVYDIETCPLPADELEVMAPEFLPAKNLKDPEKIAADVAAKRREWMDRAALSALTGRVLAIGILRGDADKPEIVHGVNEEAMIQWFWDMLPECGGMASFNGHAFDLPYLVRRSWKLRIPVPPIRSGRYWCSTFIDLRDIWALGDFRAEGTLDQISQHLGLPAKVGSGKLFFETYSSDPEAAIAYLVGDLMRTRELAKRLKA